MKLTRTLRDLLENEKIGGLILIVVTAISLALANSASQAAYVGFWNIEIFDHNLVHWINDGLMAFFFLLIGLELKREFYHGELSDMKSAWLPIAGAFGGMVVPAGIFLIFNFGTITQNGAGIPMATDIAFAIGILSLLGKRIPSSLKVFLTALAVIDDLGAIIVIAIFYTKSLSFTNLLIAVGIFGVLLLMNRQKITHLLPYMVGGVSMWYFMLQSGVHATISGVLLAFAIPTGSRRKSASSEVLEHFLVKPVTFFILPLFALANTCIALGNDWTANITQQNSFGIILGLVIGKPVGIFLFSLASVSVGLCALPRDLKWKNIIGAAFLGGIGFTMSIFITLLAFDDEALVTESKIAILLASFIAGIAGFIILRTTTKSIIR